MFYKTVLFDADGVLFNNQEGITKGIQFALRQFNLYVTDLSSLTSFIGPPLLQAFQEIAKLSETDARKAVEYYRHYFRDRGVHQAFLYDGVAEMLQGLKKSGFCVAVASSKPKIFVRSILKDHGVLDYFDAVAAADLKGTHSNKDEIIAEALQLTGSKPEETVMIGDRKYDAAGAKAHRLGFIAALYGFSEPGEFDAYECLYKASSPLDILSFLKP